jgi:hypothetical protein
VAGNKNGGLGVDVDQTDDFGVKCLLEKEVVSVESTVDFALYAENVGYFLELSFLDPVVEVCNSPESDHDQVPFFGVAHIDSCLGCSVFEICDFCQGFVGCEFARPVLNAGLGASGCGGEEGVFLGSLQVVGGQFNLLVELPSSAEAQ